MKKEKKINHPYEMSTGVHFSELGLVIFGNGQVFIIKSSSSMPPWTKFNFINHYFVLALKNRKRALEIHYYEIESRHHMYNAISANRSIQRSKCYTA